MTTGSSFKSKALPLAAAAVAIVVACGGYAFADGAGKAAQDAGQNAAQGTTAPVLDQASQQGQVTLSREALDELYDSIDDRIEAALAAYFAGVDANGQGAATDATQTGQATQPSTPTTPAHDVRYDDDWWDDLDDRYDDLYDDDRWDDLDDRYDDLYDDDPYDDRYDDDRYDDDPYDDDRYDDDRYDDDLDDRYDD